MSLAKLTVSAMAQHLKLLCIADSLKSMDSDSQGFMLLFNRYNVIFKNLLFHCILKGGWNVMSKLQVNAACISEIFHSRPKNVYLVA